MSLYGMMGCCKCVVEQEKEGIQQKRKKERKTGIVIGTRTRVSLMDAFILNERIWDLSVCLNMSM